MPRRFDSSAQADLFELSPEAEPEEPVPQDFIDRIRAELTSELDRARAADKLPYRDVEEAWRIEMSLLSMAAWLPADEARALRTEFMAELDRLYEASDEPRTDFSHIIRQSRVR